MTNLCRYSKGTISKYHNKKVIYDGIKFDSIKEKNRYAELKLLEKSGHIKELKLQVPFTLIDKSKHGRTIKYIADFVYFDIAKNERVIEDVKGYKTNIYKLKKRLLAERYGINIREM